MSRSVNRRPCNVSDTRTGCHAAFVSHLLARICRRETNASGSPRLANRLGSKRWELKARADLMTFFFHHYVTTLIYRRSIRNAYKFKFPVLVLGTLFTETFFASTYVPLERILRAIYDSREP